MRRLTTYGLALVAMVAMGASAHGAIIVQYTFEAGNGTPATLDDGLLSAPATFSAGTGWSTSFGSAGSQNAVFQNDVGNVGTSNSATTNFTNGDYSPSP